MRKIIVTGANGQLGSEIKSLPQTNDTDFIFIDIEDLDLTKKSDVNRFLNDQEPDYIVNCAAYTAVDNAEKDVEKAFQLNADVPLLLAEYCHHHNCKLIHISTDYVFSGESFIPLKETDKTDPKSVYGTSKLKGEENVLQNADAIVLRTSWLYSSFGKNFVKSMLHFFEEKEEMKIVYDQLGTPTYAADLAKVILTIIHSTVGFKAGVYHYSNEGVASWYDFAYEIRELSNKKCKLSPIETKDYPLPAPRPWNSVMNKEKVKDQFNLEIPHWKESLKICLKKLNQI